MRRSLPTGAWIAAGLVAAAVIVPAAALGGTAAVTAISGPSGHPVAHVTKENQVYTAAADPTQIAGLGLFVTPSSSSGCFTLNQIALPSQAAVITEVRVDTAQGTSTKDEVTFYTAPSCGGYPLAEINGQPGNTEQVFTPGVPVPANTDLSYSLEDGSGTFTSTIYVDGYAVAANAVPAAIHSHRTMTRAVS